MKNLKASNHLNVISVGGTIIVKDVKETVWVELSGSG
jgi:hypothetical protein